MDPNKRGNPPFEPSSYAAGLERRVERLTKWRSSALQTAEWFLDGTPEQRRLAEKWWREQLNPTPVVASSA